MLFTTLELSTHEPFRPFFFPLCLNENFDFVFIDANKREYVEYFNLIKPHLTKKCMVVADNIISHAEKVQTFVDAIDADDEFQYEIVEVPGGILTAYRE